MNMYEAASLGKKASVLLAAMDGEVKNQALLNVAKVLWEKREIIYEANGKDIKKSEEESLDLPLLKRLRFDEAKLNEVIAGIKSLILLEEPVGKVQLETQLDQGLTLIRESCPIGVIGIIFESRPDALVQIASLCLKSGNAVLLKGGKEALHTNKILSEIIDQASQEIGIPKGWLFNIESRDEVKDMLALDEFIDLIIPRGSNQFVRYIMDNSKIPVLGHADGICHGYVHADADLEMAIKVILDSKTQYVAVCNAMETLLVHEKVAAKFLPRIAKEFEEKKVLIHGCEKTAQWISCVPATDEDWKTEYLDYEISIKVVSDIKEAIDHINTYSSGHTEVIVTESEEVAAVFMSLVDAGNVFHNCSSRFSDGFRYGFGAEVGISTNKIHARGPVGLEGLLIYKYKLFGKGHIVKDYADGTKEFHHQYIKKN
ncbi:MAG: glutamate-5-semialdehyde dehydrogenase [Vallitaleaceae bacterium]|nr:glutamate-5-semialdehyde dehydrogenase [Vallitaleaceae bacterium]